MCVYCSDIVIEFRIHCSIFRKITVRSSGVQMLRVNTVTNESVTQVTQLLRSVSRRLHTVIRSVSVNPKTLILCLYVFFILNINLTLINYIVHIL